MERKTIRGLVIIFICFLILIVATIVAKVKDRNRQFTGVIEKITYSEKKRPKVTVNGKAYPLITNWRFNNNIEVGDSLIKVKGSTVYKLVKYNTREVIFSEKE